MTVRFGAFELDRARYELRHDGGVVAVEPQVFDVLAYLVEHRERVVTKEELLDNVWGDRFVSESALTSRVKAARRAIGDDGSRQELIRTAHGRGYRFVGAVAAPGETTVSPNAPLSSTAQPDIAGREHELSHLHDALDRAAAGERQLVFLAGSPGIGKTTVLDAFVGSLTRPVLIGVGQCVELRGSGEAYLPVLGAIRRACAAPGGASLVDRLVDYSPSWVLQLPGLVTTERADELRSHASGHSADRMLRELLDALAAIDDGVTLVLALEDLHWTDAATLDLLEAIATDRRPARLLVIATHRPTDGSSTSRAVHAAAVGLRLRQRASLLTLDALSPEEMRALISTRCGGRTDERIVELVHGRTGGIPLFAEHLLTEWLETGWLVNREGTVVVTRPLDELAEAIPDGVRMLIEQSADRLSLDDQAVLGAGAVAGRVFSAAEVAAALTRPEEEVEGVLAELARREAFVRAGGEGIWPDGTITSVFEFDHDLFREVLYQKVGRARSAAQHQRIGIRLVEGFESDLSPLAGALAVHFGRGGDDARAVRFHVLAAENQLQRSAHREAIGHLQLAAELAARLHQTDANVELELHVQVALGNALITAKGYAAPETTEAYRRARSLCDRLSDGPHVLPVLYGLWNASLVGGQLRAASEIAEAFLDLANRTGHQGVVVAHHAVAWPLLLLGEYASAREHLILIPNELDEATSTALIAAFGEDPAATGSAVLAWPHWFCGDDAAARAAMNAAVDRAAKLSHPLTSTYVHTLAAILAQMQDEPTMALYHADVAIRVATDHDIPVFEALSSIPLAWATGRLGRGDGVELGRAALAGMARTGTRVMRTVASATVAELHSLDGDHGAALTALDDAFEVAANTGERFFVPELHRLAAKVLASRGDRMLAASEARAAVDVARAHACQPFIARAVALASELSGE